MVCPSCGVENPERNEFCDSCGARLEEVATKEVAGEAIEEVTEEVPVESAPQMGVLVLPDGSEIRVENDLVFGRADIIDSISPSEASWVSREQFTIAMDDGRFHIEDKGSTNGTRLDGEDIKGLGPRELSEADIITLADSIDLEFKLAE